MVHGASAVERGRAYYHALGLPECSALDVVKKKYKELALALHPDKNLDDPHAADKFKQITAAYEQLSHPDRKKSIDETLATFQLNLQTRSGAETAASLFHMQRGRYYDDLHSFRTQRRATSQVTKAFSRGDSTAGRRPSQYSKEQLSDFRQREKEREREMIRRMERDREEQREIELERYRQAQEERMREEERRSREARRKLERAEATLNGQRQAYPNAAVTVSAAASISQPSARGGKAQLLTSPLPKAESVAGRGACRSQSCDLGVPVFDEASLLVSAAPDGTSVASSTSPLSNGGAFRYSNTAASPLSSPWSTHTSSQRPGLSDSPPASQMTQQMRVAREKERQDAIRRAEQERYYEKLAVECRQREVQRSRDAAEAEQRGFFRELQLLLENENGERKQYLEQEEDLERRILCATMRRTESSIHVASVCHNIEGAETNQRDAVDWAEWAERQRLALVFNWRLSVLHLWNCEESCRQDLEHKHRERCQELSRVAALRREMVSCEMDGRELLHRQFDAGCVFLWAVFGEEPCKRVALVASELGHRRRLMCFAESLRHRSDVLNDEMRYRRLMQCVLAQAQARLAIEKLEVQHFVDIQRRKGQHTQQLFQNVKRRMSGEKEMLVLRHEAYIEALMQQISALEAQLASRPSTANAYVGTDDDSEPSTIIARHDHPTLYASPSTGCADRPTARTLARSHDDDPGAPPTPPAPPTQEQQPSLLVITSDASSSDERAPPPKFRPHVSPDHEECIVAVAATDAAASYCRPLIHPAAVATISPTTTTLTSTPLLRTRTWGSTSGAQSSNSAATSAFVSAPKVAKRQSPPQAGEIFSR